MKRQKMNSIQVHYIVAKAAWQAVKEVQVEKYNEFMRLKGITEDELTDENFESYSAEYDVFAKAEIENTALAWNNYKAAEQAVIDFGLAIAPVKIRETLANGVKQLKERNWMIDLVLKLDVSTLPETLRT